jgi:WD40 repeat protein
MNQDPATITDNRIEGYPTLAALREAHGALLKQRRAAGETPELLARGEHFVQRGVATGALLDTSEDRRTAQSLLNYWANLLYRADRAPLDATLVEFDPLLAPTLPDALCPYLGLDAFSESSAERFFGRQELIAHLVERLREQRLVAIVGPSGSGKSSLVRAGLLPALQRVALPDSATWCLFPPIVPGSDPLESMQRALSAENQALDGNAGSAAGAVPLVLVVDQFEEVFTLCDDESNRQAFIAQLLALVGVPEPQHRVILTMRSDFETFIARIPELQPLFEHGRVQVTPLSAAELREAIEAPAAQVGLKFEPGVVDLLLQDILGEPAGLPLLQFTLLKLWEQRERNRVTRAAYERVGGGRQALARSADALYASLIPEEQVTARRILLRMVRPGEGLEITSSRVRRTALLLGGEDPGRVERVLGRLVDARLVRLTLGETANDDQVEVAHEALVRNWPTLVEWLEQEKVAIAARRRLESRAAEWVRLGRSEAGLLDEVEWREAERWLQSAEAQYLGYDPVLPLLVAASRAATERARAEQEAARQRELETARALAGEQERRAEIEARSARRLRWIAMWLAIMIGVSIILALAAFVQRNTAVTESKARATAAAQAVTAAAQAESERDVARSAQSKSLSLGYAGESLSELDSRPERALLLALAAVPTSTTTYPPVVTRALYSAYKDGRIRRVLRGHAKSVFSVAWSPDGRRAVTGSADGSARIWDVATGRMLLTLSGHSNTVRTVAWNPNGRFVLTGSLDKTARIWDAETGMSTLTLEGHSDSIIGVAWSLDGSEALTGSDDGSVNVWNARTGILIVSLRSPDKIVPVRSVAWSAKEDQVLAGYDDGTLRLWDISTGSVVRSMQAHGRTVLSIALSPDGKQVLTGGDDFTARIWDLATGVQLKDFKGHTYYIYSAVWSPDGSKILTASADTTARIWDVTTSTTLQVLKGHQGWIFSAAWSPDGRTLITGSEDTTARIWRAASEAVTRMFERNENTIRAVAWSPDGRQIVAGSGTEARIWDVVSGTQSQVLSGHRDLVVAVAWSPNKSKVITGSTDGTARIWDALTGNELWEFPGSQNEVNAVAWSSNGQFIAVASTEVHILDAVSGTELHTLDDHSETVYAVAWSPDGRFIATGSADEKARIWEAASGELVRTLTGHVSWVSTVAWSPDSTKLLTGSADGTARIWDASTGTALHVLKGHEGWVYSVTWSPDGQSVATSSADATARIWDAENEAELQAVRNNGGQILSIAWSPDGQQLLTGNEDRAVRILLVGKQLILADVTRRVCDLFVNQEINDLMPNWRGCETEIAKVQTDLKTYDALQSKN